MTKVNNTQNVSKLPATNFTKANQQEKDILTLKHKRETNELRMQISDYQDQVIVWQDRALKVQKEYYEDYKKFSKKIEELETNFWALVKNYDKTKAKAYIKECDTIGKEISDKSDKLKSLKAGYLKDIRKHRKGGSNA